MPGDPELESRGRLIRSLGSLREMLPGLLRRAQAGLWPA